MSLLERLLDELVVAAGSDLHVKPGAPARIRVAGALRRLDGIVTSNEVDVMVEQLLDEPARGGFLDTGEADGAYTDAQGRRFRVNVFRQQDQVAIAVRHVTSDLPSFDELGLPAEPLTQLSEQPRGLVLVTGPTGSGKSTTCAAMLTHIARTRPCHIVTIEDPVETLFDDTHDDIVALVEQREVGRDTRDFHTALRQVTRQDPDVIYIGEMRDLETVTAALQAAETGHLVISTLHTTDAVETVNRVIDLHPPHQQEQARASLAASLQGVVSQRLVSRADETGRVAAVELMVVTTRIREFLRDADLTSQVHDAIAEGDYYGMRTFDQHLLELHAAGVISFDEAVSNASNAHDFRVAARAAGITGT